MIRFAGIALGAAGLIASLPGCGGGGNEDAWPATTSPSRPAAPVPAPSTPGTAPSTAEPEADGSYAYFDLRLPLRDGWRAAGPDRRGKSHSVEIRDGECVRTEMGERKCPGFLLVGPEGIRRAYDDDGVTRNPYTPDRPYHPATDVQPCYDRDPSPALEAGTPRRTEASVRKVGGRDATYREWRFSCRDEKTGRVGTRFFVQREWYLDDERILIVDRWRTAGLADALREARWR